MDFSTIFEDKIILVTGGTGSIGSEIVNQLLKYNPKIIRIFSNSENELWETKLRFTNSISKLRFLLGDIRNLKRVIRAAENADYIFNAAAIKHVPISEYNPIETVNVNILGLDNVIEAALQCNIKKVIHISTDKAVNPTTVMGATKMVGERLCTSRNLAKGGHSTIISCVRFGNVLGSRGSIIPLIKNQLNEGDSVTLTHIDMKRFFLSISQAVDLVLKATSIAQGSEIFVLKMPTISIKDLIEVIIEEYCPIIGKDPALIKINSVGPRAGEKLNEELISPVEYPYCYETDDLYIISPNTDFGQEITLNYDKIGKKIDDSNNFHYSTEFITPLTKQEIKDFIKEFELI